MTQENELDINNQEKNKGKLTHFNEAGEAHMVDAVSYTHLDVYKRQVYRKADKLRQEICQC